MIAQNVNLKAGKRSAKKRAFIALARKFKRGRKNSNVYIIYALKRDRKRKTYTFDCRRGLCYLSYLFIYFYC